LLHDIARAARKTIRSPARKCAAAVPRLGFNAADTELVAWLIEQGI